MRYKWKSVHEVLQMTVEQGGGIFGGVPPSRESPRNCGSTSAWIRQLGQCAATLSGGERGAA